MGQLGFLPCNGAEIYYELAGAGETIVLLHGAPLDSRMWRPQMEALSQKYQVLRFDMRGMGQSLDPGIPFTLYVDLHSLLAQLGIESATFVGASFGCYAAVEYALAFPHQANGLVLLCPGGFAPPSASYQQRLQPFQEQFGMGNMKEAVEIILHIVLDGPDQERGRVQPHRQWLKEIYADIYRKAQPATMPKWLEPDPRSRLAEISVPTQVVIGELDHSDFLKAADTLVQTIPGAEQIRLPQSAHLPSIDNPDAVNQIIVDFCLHIPVQTSKRHVQLRGLPVTGGPLSFDSPVPIRIVDAPLPSSVERCPSSSKRDAGGYIFFVSLHNINYVAFYSSPALCYNI